MFVFVYDKNAKSMVHYASHEHDDFLKLFDSDQYSRQFYTNQDYVQLGGRKQDLDGQYEFESVGNKQEADEESDLDGIQPNAKVIHNDLVNLSIESKSEHIEFQQKNQKNSISQCFKQLEKLIQKNKDFEKKLMMQSINLESEPLLHQVQVDKYKSSTEHTDPTKENQNENSLNTNSQPMPILDLQNGINRQKQHSNIIDIESQQNKLNNKMKEMAQSSNFCDRFFLKKRHHPDRNRFSSPPGNLNNSKDSQKNPTKIFSIVKNENKDQDLEFNYEDCQGRQKQQRVHRQHNFQKVQEPDTPLTNQLINQGIFLQPMMYHQVKQLGMLQPYELSSRTPNNMTYLPTPFQLNVFQNQTWNVHKAKRRGSIYSDDNKAPIFKSCQKFQAKDTQKSNPHIKINNVDFEDTSLKSEFSGKLSSITPMK